jgi:hypothetical protein
MTSARMMVIGIEARYHVGAIGSDELNGSVGPGSPQGKVNDAGEDPKDQGLPGNLKEVKEMSCQRENYKEEECARKDGDDGDVIGTHPENPPPGDDRVCSKTNS